MKKSDWGQKRDSNLLHTLNLRRLLNLQELLNSGLEMDNVASSYDIRINFFSYLNPEQDLSSGDCTDDCSFSKDKTYSSPSESQYRLCRHEKELRSLIKRNKFGFERVESVEKSIIEFMKLEKPGKLSFILKDSFERLLIHILCRYYRLDSYSKFIILNSSRYNN